MVATAAGRRRSPSRRCRLQAQTGFVGTIQARSWRATACGSLLSREVAPVHRGHPFALRVSRGCPGGCDSAVRPGCPGRCDSALAPRASPGCPGGCEPGQRSTPEAAVLALVPARTRLVPVLVHGRCDRAWGPGPTSADAAAVTWRAKVATCLGGPRRVTSETCCCLLWP